MRPIIKSIGSPDIDYPENPQDCRDCRILIEIEIGPSDGEGSDIFSFEAVTPSQLSGSNPIWGYGLLIIDQFCWEEISLTLDKLMSHCWGKNWAEISSKLNRELRWEFENYRD